MIEVPLEGAYRPCLRHLVCFSKSTSSEKAGFRPKTPIPRETPTFSRFCLLYRGTSLIR